MFQAGSKLLWSCDHFTGNVLLYKIHQQLFNFYFLAFRASQIKKLHLWPVGLNGFNSFTWGNEVKVVILWLLIYLAIAWEIIRSISIQNF